jgi:hypothetical protein
MMKEIKVSPDKYYVYVICESSSMSPIYIGKGKNNRANWHLYASKFGYHYNKKLERKLKKITNNFTDMSKIQINIDSEYDNEYYALERESKIINEIGLSKLCNLTHGGESPSLSQTSIKKIVESRKSNGKPWHSEETRKRIGEAGKGRKHSEETKRRFKQNHKKPMLGKTHTEETRQLMSINHVDFNGEKNPFFGKSHNKEVREYFRLKYGHEWMIHHNGNQISVIGKSGVREYVENYNKENNISISYKTLIMYKKINKHNIQIVNNGKWGK